jgi:predicted patatin/cPLA2 family phospholipase
MRGVVSAGMASALERRLLLDCFDLVVGTSAGALNAAAFLAGVVEGCLAAYHAAFATRRFINPYRLLIGRAAIDVGFTLDHADEGLDTARHSRTVASDIPLHCIAVDVDTASAQDLTDLRSEEDLRCALLASSRMPWIGGGPVEFRGRRWLDGGLAEPIPHRVAVRLGATHVLVLMTRPLGVSRTPPPQLANWMIERRLRRLNPALVELHHRRATDYEEAVREIEAATGEPGPDGPFVYGLRLSRGGPEVAQLERRRAVLEAAGRLAMEHAAAVLDAAGVR